MDASGADPAGHPLPHTSSTVSLCNTVTIFSQRENPVVVGLRPTARGVSDATLFTACVNRVSVGTFLPVRPVWPPNRGGMTAPMSGQSDNFGIPARLSQVSPAGAAQDTDPTQQGTSESPHGIGVTGAWHSPHLVGVQTRGSQTSRHAVVGSPAGYGAEDVTRPLFIGCFIYTIDASDQRGRGGRDPNINA